MRDGEVGGILADGAGRIPVLRGPDFARDIGAIGELIAEVQHGLQLQMTLVGIGRAREQAQLRVHGQRPAVVERILDRHADPRLPFAIADAGLRGRGLDIGDEAELEARFLRRDALLEAQEDVAEAGLAGGAPGKAVAVLDQRGEGELHVAAVADAQLDRRAGIGEGIAARAAGIHPRPVDRLELDLHHAPGHAARVVRLGRPVGADRIVADRRLRHRRRAAAGQRQCRKQAKPRHADAGHSHPPAFTPRPSHNEPRQARRSPLNIRPVLPRAPAR